MLILSLLGMYFDAAVLFHTKSSLLFRLAVAILCFVNALLKKGSFCIFQKRKKWKSILRITTNTEQIWSVPFLNSKLTVTFQLNQKNIKELVQKPKKVKDIFVVLDTVFRGQNMGFGNIRVDEKYVGQKLKWNW